ncbi:MAG: hypothetical protein GEV07_17855 [Streptosporangiales bacterium]|nr:hypothetical protein [Streptosporangiales bacterium]
MTFLDVTDSYLLVIDMQSDFYGPDRRDIDRAALDAAFQTAAWVTAVSRSLGVPTVVTEEDAASNGTTTAAIVETARPVRASSAPLCAG